MTKERNYFIDFLKSIFSIIIVIFHGRIFSEHIPYFAYGFLAVDFYFIVTGYLMIQSLEKDKSKMSIPKKTYLFLKSKILGIYPYIFFAFILGSIFYFRQLFPFKYIITNSYFILELLQLSSLVGTMSINGATWYISTMLLTLFILYPLALKFKENYLTIIVPSLLLFFMSVVYNFNIPITDPYVSHFFLLNGVYKAFIFILLGNITFVIAKYIKNIKFNNLAKVLLTIVELSIYLILILNMNYYYFVNELTAVLFVIAIAISFSNQSYTYKYLNFKVFQKFSTFTFILYLNHIYIRAYTLDHNMHLSYRYLISKYFILAILISIFMYIFVPLIVKIINRIFKFLKNKLLIS